MTCPHWKSAWRDGILTSLSQQRILVVCDFDGTLSPIAPTPQQAELPANTRGILRSLSVCPGVDLAFLSGREISDLKEKVGMEGATFFGNHGMQMESRDNRWESVGAMNHRANLSSALADLRKEVGKTEGILFEDKGLTASIHWRLVSEADRLALHVAVATVASKYDDLRLTHGKSVWELRPNVNRDKGTAMRELLENTAVPSSQAIFLGDDETDEAAFQVLSEGVTVRVGKPAGTFARYSATDTSDVAALLSDLLNVRMDILKEGYARRD
jgi:trehalose 6-phosphate phosphatase